jgi:hypothetical protein
VRSRVARVRSLTLVVAAATLFAAAPAQARPAACRHGFAAGAAAVDVTPRPPRGHALSEVQLGGYGFGAGRGATWVRHRLFARAWSAGCARGGRLDPRRAVAIVEVDNQGMQVAYRGGAPGSTGAIRTAAARRARIPRRAIVVASNHSHAGPDLIGVWGFVPSWYLRQIQRGAVRALVQAGARARLAQLRVGAVRAPALVHTQFNDPAVGASDHVDDALRVVRAVDRRGRALATLVEFAAHSTVMGSANRGTSPDWTGVLAARLERARRRWGTVVVLEGTNGKTQPTTPEAPMAIRARPEMTAPGDPRDADEWEVERYAGAVAAKVASAARRALPVRGHTVGGDTRYLAERATNALLLGLVKSGTVRRLDAAPWTSDTGVGTLVSSLRVGDLAIDATPGESYPAVQHRVEAAAPAVHHLLAGLANDQLGYLIAPETEYPTAEREARENGNDNTLFNVSPGIGDHVTCALLDAEAATGAAVRARPAVCDRFPAATREPRSSRRVASSFAR